MKTKKLTELALLTVVALIIFVVELQIPNPIPIPGAKLGLANIITVYAVYHYGAREVFLIIIVRVLLGSFFSGNMMALLFSLAGGLLCLVGMLVMKKAISKKYIWLCSLFGAVFHNIGQIVIACLIAGWGMQSNGGVALWEQFYILDGDLVGDSFKLEAHRLGRTQKVFPEGLFLTSKSGQRQPGGNAHRTLCFSTSLFDFLGDGCKGKQVVIVVFHFVAQDRLSAGPADIKLSAEFQCILQGVGFMGILCNTGWERKMPGFDCVIAMVDANVHGFTHPFLLVVENLRFLLS